MDIRVFGTVDKIKFEVKVQKAVTVFDVKTAVMEAYGIPIANQQLKFKGRVLLDNDPLSLYKIKQKCVIWLKKISTPSATKSHQPSATSSHQLPATSSHQPPASKTQAPPPARVAYSFGCAPGTTTTPAEVKGGATAIAATPESDDADHNIQLNYIKELFTKRQKLPYCATRR